MRRKPEVLVVAQVGHGSAQGNHRQAVTHINGDVSAILRIVWAFSALDTQETV